MKNAFASGSSKSQMLPSLFPFPASFFNVLPLPQKFNRFRFHIPGQENPHKQHPSSVVEEKTNLENLCSPKIKQIFRSRYI